jgi:para-aminobenzoate synthetase component 1
MQLQQEINALGLSAAQPDLPFREARWACLATIWAPFRNAARACAGGYFLPDMAVGLYDWALIVDHQKKTVSLLSHRDAARLAWLEAQQPAPAETFTLTSGWRSNMSEQEYARKIRPRSGLSAKRRLLSG